METCEAVKTTPDGGYILAGTTRSNDGDVNGYHGNYDYWVVKLGPQCTGSIDIEASATNICSDSSVTFTSSIVNGGTSPVYQWKVNGINVGTNSSTFTTFSLRDNDSVVCILNSNAPCIANPIIRSDTIIMHIRKCSPVPPSLGCQDKNFFNLYQQANGDNFPRQSIVTADNSIIIIGENVIGRQGGYNSFITKISKDGNNQWFKLIEGNMSQVLSGLTELRDGNFIAIGGLRDATKVGFFLIKFDTNGNVLWRKDYNIPNVGESLGNMHLKEDIDGSIIIQTQFAERGLSFSDRPMIIKIDSTGTILFCKYYTPPGGISALYMQDFIIKDGYSYVVGGFYYGNSIKGILLKINNSTGNLSFCNLYNFNNGGVYFTQILPYKNDRFCIIGPDDINPQDTSLIFVIDTLGNCSSSKYFQFNIPGTPRTYGSAAITSGYDLLWVGDFRKPPLTLTSLTLSRINPETGIQYNKDFQQINLYPRISTTLISSDSSIIATGNKEDATGLYSIFFGKFSKEGELGCTPITIPSSFGSGISQVISLSMTTTNKSYPVFQTAYTAKPYPLLKDSICSSVNMCDTIKLTTGNTVCNTVDTLKIKIYKNPECTSTPSMTFDSQYLQLLSMSNSAINFKVLRSGSLKVYASIQTSCFQLKDSLTIQIMLSPSVLNLGPDTVLCPGNTILLNAKKGFATYQWQDGSTDSTLTVTQPGTYFVKTTNACGGVFYDTVIVSPHPPIPFDLGPDLSKCNADSLTISLPTGFLNYIWTPSYNNITTNTQTVIVFPSTDTIYIVRAEKTPGCFAYDSIRIKVYTSPKINLGTDTSLCGSDSLTLNAGVGFNKYLWNTGSLAQQITVNSAGAYSVTATTTQNCISKDTLTILAVTPNPFVALDHDSTLCAGTARVLNAGNFISYLWNTGNTSQTISVNNTGIYSVTVTDNNNCKGSDSTKIVTILPSPANFLPADTAVCSYGSVLIASKVSYAKYLWNTNGLTPSITITQPGVYWLQVIDKNNCSGRDSITVAQKDCMKGFYIPNAFSPNHDGKNDLFRPMLFGKVMLYEFAIYNQWGEIVFKSTDVSKGWDGNYKKLPQDTFVFVWTCKYQFENEPVKLEKGTVTLIR
ncbi:MAG: hypothetical protein JWM28_2073 [Chitinophagaceae bacterium]|nr:hypothetical protein [Chitinophagaceae bacterium]